MTNVIDTAREIEARLRAGLLVPGTRVQDTIAQLATRLEELTDAPRPKMFDVGDVASVNKLLRIGLDAHATGQGSSVDRVATAVRAVLEALPKNFAAVAGPATPVAESSRSGATAAQPAFASGSNDASPALDAVLRGVREAQEKLAAVLRETAEAQEELDAVKAEASPSVPEERRVYAYRRRGLWTGYATCTKARYDELSTSPLFETRIFYTDPVKEEADSPALSRAVIRSVFLNNGFSIKPGDDDLKPYVYDAAFALLRRAGRVPPRDEFAYISAWLTTATQIGDADSLLAEAMAERLSAIQDDPREPLIPACVSASKGTP